MNKWHIAFLLCHILFVLSESSIRDKQKLIKALKEKFKQFKMKGGKETAFVHGDKVDPLTTSHANGQNNKEKAASAIGLALLDLAKSKHPEVHDTTQNGKTKAVSSNVDPDDNMDEDEDYDDDDNSLSNDKKKEQKTNVKNIKSKDNTMKMDSATARDKKEKENEQENDVEDDENSGGSENDESGSGTSSDMFDEEGESKQKSSDKQSKNTGKSLKNSFKSLKDKDLQSVNVGELKKLLATSVENLDKAEKAIHELLQYDEQKKSSKKNNQTPPPATSGFQPTYNAYPQVPASSYQQTCPGQCSSLCAPACRDPCCRFPPNSGYNPGYNAGPVQARGSYQQGLVNAYPPLTSLGSPQGGQGNQGQMFGQQCGSQCSPQSCAPSCNPSCCSSGTQAMGPIIPQGQANAGCPSSCLSNCAGNCAARCCVPGRK